ncbi:MAG TPA: hypothetical protein VF892_20745 [Pseudonocardiaceae bacterium]
MADFSAIELVIQQASGSILGWLLVVTSRTHRAAGSILGDIPEYGQGHGHDWQHIVGYISGIDMPERFLCGAMKGPG